MNIINNLIPHITNNCTNNNNLNISVIDTSSHHLPSITFPSTRYFKSKHARIIYLQKKNLEQDIKNKNEVITTDLNLKNFYIYNSTESTFVVKGKILSNHDITIIAKNLIVKGTIQTSQKLKIQLEGMLIFEGKGFISGLKDLDIECKEVITNEGLHYINQNNQKN